MEMLPIVQAQTVPWLLQGANWGHWKGFIKEKTGNTVRKLIRWLLASLDKSYSKGGRDTHLVPEACDDNHCCLHDWHTEATYNSHQGPTCTRDTWSFCEIFAGVNGPPHPMSRWGEYCFKSDAMALTLRRTLQLTRDISVGWCASEYLCPWFENGSYTKMSLLLTHILGTMLIRVYWWRITHRPRPLFMPRCVSCTACMVMATMNQAMHMYWRARTFGPWREGTSKVSIFSTNHTSCGPPLAAIITEA